MTTDEIVDCYTEIPLEVRASWGPLTKYSSDEYAHLLGWAVLARLEASKIVERLGERL